MGLDFQSEPSETMAFSPKRFLVHSNPQSLHLLSLLLLRIVHSYLFPGPILVVVSGSPDFVDVSSGQLGADPRTFAASLFAAIIVAAAVPKRSELNSGVQQFLSLSAVRFPSEWFFRNVTRSVYATGISRWRLW